MNLDVCSAGELAVALSGGMPADRIALHGNNKSAEEIERAVGEGVGRIVLDSFEEIVRVAHIALFVLASRDDARFRSSVVGLAVSTAIGVGLLVAASFADGLLQGGLWALALALDMGGPYFFGADGFDKSSPNRTNPADTASSSRN